jgi:flagellar biosynthetic protein FlhB
MAADQDAESKTEEPTEKRIADAFEKGNVPRSREISIFASLLGLLILLGFAVGPRGAELANLLGLLLDHPAAFSLRTGGDAGRLLAELAKSIGAILLPLLLILAVAGIAASFAQHMPTFALDQIRPKWSRLSPAAGWKRIFGSGGWVEFLKSLFKVAAIGVVIAILFGSDRQRLLDAMRGEPQRLPATILAMVFRLVATVCVALVVMVAADLMWSRLRWRRELRMSRQELKDELRQSEGDPLIKSRLRSLARDRARKRMMAAVPRATLVVANPTHYAVALKYERGKDGAPLVIAKGADLIALRIREIASQHAVPIMEDKPLARALYETVEVGKWIPPEFYRAVAKLLYVLYSRKTHARVS